jgi:lipoprotein-anchoring transpeptidase ErfK/SrfK
MYKRYFSKKYNGSPMPYSIFFRGGYAVHGTNAVSQLGRPASHGCVRLRTKNAARLYSLVKRHGGRIVVTN